jgi:penicillin-binding protein 2
VFGAPVTLLSRLRARRPAAARQRRHHASAVRPEAEFLVAAPRRVAGRTGGTRRPRDPSGPLLSQVPTPYLGSGAFLGRVAVLGGVALVVFAVLLLRLWALEIANPQSFLRSAEGEATRVVDLPAARGAIISSEGAPLAGTTGELAVSADAATLGQNTGGVWRPSATGLALLGRVAALAKTSRATLVGRIRDDLQQDAYAPSVILADVSEPLGSYLSERASEFRGISVSAEPGRSYPQGALGGAFLGYTAQVSAAELAGGAYPWAKPGEAVGQSGVEASYDRALNGGFTEGTVHVNSLGQQLGPVAPHGETRHPATLQLTINLSLQRAAQRAIESGIRLAHAAGYTRADAGAAVVLNPQTGAIEALASAPELDQAALADDPAYLSGLLESGDASSPLFDQATQGLFPLGSTFKPVVAEAALSAGLLTPTSTLRCLGSLTVGGIVFHNVESWIDEVMTLPQALEISCDTWFYQLGERFFARQQQGKLDIQRWAELFGFGRPTEVDIPGEAAGVVPTPAWLERSEHEQWYEGDSVNLSIGQGFLEATPLQLAVAYAALANGGTVVRPHLGEAVISDGERRALSFPPVRHLALRDLATIRDGLYLAAHAPEGTSSAVFANYPIAVDGKTGTAQTSGGQDDSWYASWAPANDPKVVVVVLIEDGGYGADAAAPAAREIYNTYFGLGTGTAAKRRSA